MTPAELDEFAANFSGLKDVGRVVAALRTAWAERDEAFVAYVHAVKQRSEAEARHVYCDENKKDLRAHRDRLERELEVAKMLHESAAMQRPEDWDDVVTKLQEERDARPDAATVAKVREALVFCRDGLSLDTMEKKAREALRLLEEKP